MKQRKKYTIKERRGNYKSAKLNVHTESLLRNPYIIKLLFSRLWTASIIYFLLRLLFAFSIAIFKLPLENTRLEAPAS